MPVQMQKLERYPGTDRDKFARAVLNYCRAYRSDPKIGGAQFYWADAGNTIGVVVWGEPGCFDYNPNPDPNMLKAAFAVADLGNQRSSEVWQDAGPGARSWEAAGRPSGAS